MTDNFLLNNTNASAMGIFFEDGTNKELLKMAKLKPGITQDWMDEHGTERDDTNLFYESRVLNLPVMLIGANETDLLTKFQAFKDFLMNGYFMLKCQKLNRQYKLLYSDMTNVDWQPEFVTFTLTLIDDFPQLIIPYA